MKKVLAKTGIPLLCATMLFAGCGIDEGQQSVQSNPGKVNTYNARTSHYYGNGNQYEGMFGNNGRNNGTYGMNNNTTNGGYGGYGSYSMNNNRAGGQTAGILGTDSQGQQGGITSRIEAQLNHTGMRGVRVLVLGDTVYVGQPDKNNGGTYGSTLGTNVGSGTTMRGMNGTNNRDQNGLFGTNGTNNRDQNGLFGMNGTNNRGQNGLFGTNNNDRNGLFGMNGTNNRDQTGLFGTKGTTNNRNQNGLFGTNNNDRNGLFGTNGANRNDRMNGTYRTKATGEDSLSNVRSQIQQILGSNTPVIMVTDPSAIAAMDRVKRELKSNKAGSSEISSADISLIMNNGKTSGVQAGKGKNDTNVSNNANNMNPNNVNSMNVKNSKTK